ncbi:MAG: hypothetical protein JST93_25655 [Acidobacteria bacterium]|nr:hypothetical protein [Acidobacteriota bacterium]
MTPVPLDRDIVLAMELGETRAFADLYDAMPAHLRSALGAHIEEWEAAAVFRMRGIDYSDFNRALGLGIRSEATQQDVERIVSGFRAAASRQFLVHLAPSPQQPQLRQWCADLGLKRKRSWVKVYRRRERPAAFLTDFTVREAFAAEAAHLGAVACSGFGMPPELSAWVSALAGRPGWRHFLAWEQDTPVAGGSMFLYGKAAWLGLASTLPDKRRRGAQGAILHARIRAAIDAGAELIFTEAAEDLPNKPNPSFHNLLRAGFSLAYVRENYGRKA